jgi:hypothetical protein
VAGKVLVDLHRTVSGLDGSQLGPTLARSHLRSPFLKEENVGGHLSAGVRFERGVGQSHGAEQDGPFRQMAPHGAVLLVHGVPAGDERKHAAGPDHIQGLREKVIVDRLSQVRTAAVRRIVHRKVSEWDVPDCRIEKVLGKGRVLEPLGMNVGVRIELGGDAGGDGIKLDARAARAWTQAFGHHAKEMADAHRRFENTSAGLQSETFHRLPDRLDDFRRRVMGVRCRRSRRCVLLGAQYILQLGCHALPLARRVRLKCVRHRAPASVLHEHGLFLRCGNAVLGFYSFQRSNGGEIGLGFLPEAAFTDAVGGRYAEVVGKG